MCVSQNDWSGTGFDQEYRFMFIQRLLNQDSSPLLEQMLRFTEARQRLLSEDVANASTPNYQQKDLDMDKFQGLLRRRIEDRDSAPPGSVNFNDIGAEVQRPHNTLMFHDHNNRSMENLMADNARNALFHNLIVELLRKQYAAMDMALKERVT
jgi:flagellar basal-body rod protein FlgB